jgi:DNA repair photolyase
MIDIKKFDALNVSSKFAICGLPIRIDSYKTCSFGCKYCFAENREIMKYDKHIQVADIKKVERKLTKIFDKKEIDNTSFLEVLISKGITWHWGGMSDPFQPCEKKLSITKKLIDITNKYGIHILFSTKSSSVYDADIKPELHSFQLSISNVDNLKNIEPNVPNIEERYKFYRELKDKGFKVGIRIQPFIPNISTLKIVEMFKDADNFTLEGIKIVPQNKESKEFILNELGLKKDDFIQMGLLNLKPEIRKKMYEPFIKYFKENNIPYSIADNDMRYLGTNKCCCGDRLVKNSTEFNSTAMIKKFGLDYQKSEIDNCLLCGGVSNCRCNHLFTSNRQEGCKTVQDFYDKRFYRKTSPFSPQYQYKEERKDIIEGQTNIFDFIGGNND